MHTARSPSGGSIVAVTDTPVFESGDAPAGGEACPWVGGETRWRATSARLGWQATDKIRKAYRHGGQRTARQERPGPRGFGRHELTMSRPFDGSLFAEGFHREAITELPDWALSGSALDDLPVSSTETAPLFLADLSDFILLSQSKSVES